MQRALAKELRGRMTDAERRLWYRLRAHRFHGMKVKRQAPIGPYVVDFVCFERRLVVELDGGQHADSAADRRRDDWLRNEGYRVLRFWNADVLRRTESVLSEISDALTHSDVSTPLPARFARHPLPQGERGNSRQG